MASAGGSLGEQAVPELISEQVRRFTTKSLQAKPVRRFDPQVALGIMQRNDGEQVLAVDIGGDKIVASHFIMRHGAAREAGDVLRTNGDGGSGYLAALEDVAGLARRRNLRVGISLAGPTDGTRLIASPNLPVFVAEFQQRYGSDFRNLFAAVEVTNDAEAGIMAGALEAARRFQGVQCVIYIINGSGLGGSVLTKNTIYATEPGHIEIVDQLNVFGQRKPCGLQGASHVCIEAVAASKAGVEDIWFQQTGVQLAGQEIAARYVSGDRLALNLYDISALVTAHAITGIGEAFQVLDDVERTVIVGHGGIFYVPGYGERLRSILKQNHTWSPEIIFTKDFSANTCLEGAAIAAASGHLLS